MGKIQDAQDQYCLALTDEAIEKLKNEGQDVAILYKKREEARNRNKFHLEKLNEYKKTPRDPQSQFAKKGIKVGFFGSSNGVVDSPLVYGALVDDPVGMTWTGSNALVVVFTLDERYKYDIAWLSDVAAKVESLRNAAVVSEDMKKIKDGLVNSHYQFCLKVGQSVVGDAEVWCCTFFAKNTKQLPKTFIPGEHILPFLVTGELKEVLQIGNIKSALDLINKEFYL